ncbi:MAG TPA: hypothetical protein PL168_07180 [Methanobacterium sp.]|jgi:hypothetical protein|nr:hypothetical protein [Methanobacterium sp.]HOI40495.1 hypothetical protein [Methanobacterium sp.]
MVSNEEISHQLRNKREGKDLKYLVCDSCQGYYELKSNESIEDFDLLCECGGSLIQSNENSLYGFKENYLSEEEYEYNRYRSEIFLGYGSIFVGGAVIMGFYLLSRHNKRANFHGKILLLIALIPFLMFILFMLANRTFR